MVSSTPGPVYSFLHSLPVPSLPFNIEHWVPGSTPLSTTPEVVYAISFYLVVIFGGQALMRGSKPYRESSRSLVLGAAERGCVSAGESGHGDASFASHGLAVWPEGASAGTAEVAEVLGTRATRPIGQLGGAIEGTRRTRSFTLLCAAMLTRSRSRARRLQALVHAPQLPPLGGLGPPPRPHARGGASLSLPRLSSSCASMLT